MIICRFIIMSINDDEKSIDKTRCRFMAERLNYNIAFSLEEIAENIPQASALTVRHGKGYKTYTFSDLQQTCDRYCAFLFRQGISRGRRVILMVPPSMDFVCLTFALFRLDAVVILIDPGMGYKNLLRCIGSVRPDALIGIPKAQIFSRIFPVPFKTIRTRICVGNSYGLLGKSLRAISRENTLDFPVSCSTKDDLAAIIFTTGSTGPPKGVQYTHGIFKAQIGLIRNYYGIVPGDVDQPCFPLFALFSTALGAKAVIPDMNPAKPALVDPKKFIRTILDHKVTYSFGSPAIWNVVSRYCLDNNIRLPLRKILMAGAPVSGELVERVQKIIVPNGEIHTPYGATESLPVTSITGIEIIKETWKQTREGMGTCVGKPLPGNVVRIIEEQDGAIFDWDEVAELAVGEIGEIVVSGEVVTGAYDNNPEENRLSKIKNNDRFWHRIGDMGYLDSKGRLWFCGRKAHTVSTELGKMYTIPCEAIFNNHPRVFRSALVGVGQSGNQKPVLIVEPNRKIQDQEQLVDELKMLAQQYELTQSIETFLVHPSFPVDIRHNAKIFREKLAVWAVDQLRG